MKNIFTNSSFTLLISSILTNVRRAGMAWRSSGNSNEELVNNLKKGSIITNERVENAMKFVDRKNYVRRYPYEDSPQTIGHGATISAPHMHAYALESLEPYLQPGMKVLDVGSGSGYLTACMGAMVAPSGKVIGIEHIHELVDMSKQNLQMDHPDFLEKGIVKFEVGDGRKGYPEEAPYDAIHVGAAPVQTPQDLINQLKAPGRIFIPVGPPNNQKIIQIDKHKDGSVHEKNLMNVMYVPLTSEEEQRGSYNM